MHTTPLLLLALLAGPLSAQDPAPAALQTPEQRLAANPEDTTALSQLAIQKLRDGRRSGQHEDLAAAESLFVRWVALRPDSADAYAGLAYARLGRHEFEGALDAARAAALRKPSSSQLLALLGDVHFALGHYVEAQMAFERLEQDGLTLQSRARMGLIQEAYGRYDDALTAFHEAQEAGRLLESPAADLAWCENMIGDLEQQRGRLDDAMAAFGRALQLDPQSNFADHGRADVLLRRGQPEQAEPVLRALVARSTNPAYWVQLGDALAALGRQDEAKSWYDRALADMEGDLAKGELGHLRDQAELLLQHGGDPQRAAELALRDLHEVRQDTGAYATAAWALHQAGRSQEALPLIAEALRPGGGDAQLFRRASEIYAAAGNQFQSRRMLALADARGVTGPAR